MSWQDELVAIYRRRGELTNELVVEEAKTPGTELHGQFNWNVEEAAYAHWLDRAGELIRTVRVVYAMDEDTGEQRTVRAWSPVREASAGKRRGYAPTEEIAQDPVAAKVLLRQAERELEAHRRKYGHLAEYMALVAKVMTPAS